MAVPERSYLNRRRSQRAAVVLPASVVTMSSYQYFELIDLSATGAKMRGPTIPPLGKTALFRLQSYQALCRVVWADNGVCGVRFDELIPARVLEELRGAGTAAKVGLLTPDKLQAVEP
jgi:PilZ domain